MRFLSVGAEADSKIFGSLDGSTCHSRPLSSPDGSTGTRLTLSIWDGDDELPLPNPLNQPLDELESGFGE